MDAYEFWARQLQTLYNAYIEGGDMNGEDYFKQRDAMLDRAEKHIENSLDKQTNADHG